MRRIRHLFALAAAAFAGLATLTALQGQSARQSAALAQQSADQRVFEMRIYTTHPGTLDALNKRFRDHTTRLFEKHGMTNIGYWVPTEGEKGQNTLIYIIAHKSRQAARDSFKAFGADPEWRKAATESEKDGKIVMKVESIFMQPTNYSPMK